MSTTMSMATPEPLSTHNFNIHDCHAAANHGIHTHSLTATQERRLVEDLDQRFLDLTRNYSKRAELTTSLPTLPTYLGAARTLFAIILQIPPLDPSASLRTTFLLRLTHEIMVSVPGYAPTASVLPLLLAFFDMLDKGWLAVLRGQAWDPVLHRGVDIGAHPLPVNQTERTRLHSLLVTGTAELEEWLAGLHVGKEEEGGEADYDIALERMGLQQDFDDLFFGTLSEMGALGEETNDPAGMTGTC